ncbi:MAG: hypothetical protein ACREU1_12280 [Burkholderiales bacterium]
MRTRRDVLRALAAGGGMLAMPAALPAALGAADSTSGSPAYDEAVAKVIPEKGFQSRIRLRDSVVRLVRLGVIDKSKFEKLYADRGGLPRELRNALSAPSEQPIHLTRQNADYYVNLLWPLGLANYMSSNMQSPINKLSPVNGQSLFDFASTGGWNLGKEVNGGAYFNKFKIVELTPEREALVTKAAKNTYRPCCDNSTFFQDCNHGSALLGLLQLGASQGLAEDELYREALAFNSFWFPPNYIYSALYFRAVKGEDWGKVDPKAVLGKDFSSASGSGRIQREVAKIPNLVPKQRGEGEGCSV